VLDYLRDGNLSASHLALLVVLVGQLENGETLALGGRFEDGGETLVRDERGEIVPARVSVLAADGPTLREVVSKVYGRHVALL
jgi:hypothetical protein